MHSQKALARQALEALYKNSNGSPPGSPGWSLAWCKQCVRRAGIDNLDWHDLRQRLVMGGLDLRSVQDLLRHKSILMTMRYARLSPDHKRGAVERLDPKPQIVSGTRSGTSIVARIRRAKQA